MRKRLLLSAATMAGLVGVGLVVLAMLPPRPGVTKVNFDRVKKGMTLAEVQAILGDEGEVPGPGRRIWRHTDKTVIIVDSDEHGGFNQQFFPSDETFADKLRRWLHLPASDD